MSAEGEAIRSNDYRKDTTVKAPSTRPAAVLGLDVGKSSHWACLIDRDGEVLSSAPVRNREAELDALFASAPAGTLVVVDQFRNIGSLAVRRARAAGLGVAYLPGLAASRAEALEAARALSSQRDHVVACATRDKNRLRAVLLESCPALEAAVDLSDRRWLELLAGFGGAWGIARSGAEGPQAEAAGEAAAASTAPPPALIEAENRQVRFLATRISEALDEAGALEAETAALLEGDETYACLLTVPGIGPRTAAQLAVSVDIGRFPDHDHLASYCGIAPRVRSSGTSVRSVRASRRGDARLKSLLIFSCNSLVRSSGRYGEYYRACRARGMGHGRALKAVARKRLRAIYAVMRDRVPYRE